MANKAPARAGVKARRRTKGWRDDRSETRLQRLVGFNPKQTEGPGTSSEAFPLFVCVRRRTEVFYADALTPAIQVWAMEATEQ